MKEISYFNKIYISTRPIDFRKQIYGLSMLVKGIFELSPLESDRSLFVFLNRNKQSIKILYWDKTGFAMWQKNLEKEKFKWKFSKNNEIDEKKSISQRELKWLLEGIDISRLKSHEELHFSDVI